MWSTNESEEVGEWLTRHRETHVYEVSYPLQIEELKRLGVWDPEADGEAHVPRRSGSALRQRAELLATVSSKKFYGYFVSATEPVHEAQAPNEGKDDGQTSQEKASQQLMMMPPRRPHPGKQWSDVIRHCRKQLWTAAVTHSAKKKANPEAWLKRQKFKEWYTTSFFDAWLYLGPIPYGTNEKAFDSVYLRPSSAPDASKQNGIGARAPRFLQQQTTDLNAVVNVPASNVTQATAPIVAAPSPSLLAIESAPVVRADDTDKPAESSVADLPGDVDVTRRGVEAQEKKLNFEIMQFLLKEAPSDMLTESKKRKMYKHMFTMCGHGDEAESSDAAAPAVAASRAAAISAREAPTRIDVDAAGPRTSARPVNLGAARSAAVGAGAGKAVQPPLKRPRPADAEIRTSQRREL